MMLHNQPPLLEKKEKKSYFKYTFKQTNYYCIPDIVTVPTENVPTGQGAHTELFSAVKQC